MAGINCIVVTPEATVLEKEADMVIVPLIDGEKGVGAGHAPTIGRLGYGELRVKTASATDHYYVDGGFVQIADNTVSVITNRAVEVSDIDKQAAQKQLDAAQAMTGKSVAELAEKERLSLQARAQLRLAK